MEFVREKTDKKGIFGGEKLNQIIIHSIRTCFAWPFPYWIPSANLRVPHELLLLFAFATHVPQQAVGVFQLVLRSVEEDVARDHVVSGLWHVHAAGGPIDEVVLEEVPGASPWGARARLDLVGSEVEPVRSLGPRERGGGGVETEKQRQQDDK